jgi:hypothetical protein
LRLGPGFVDFLVQGSGWVPYTTIPAGGGGVFPSLTNFSLFELLFFLIVLGTMLTRIPVIAEVIHLSLVFTGKIGLK